MSDPKPTLVEVSEEAVLKAVLEHAVDFSVDLGGAKGHFMNVYFSEKVFDYEPNELFVQIRTDLVKAAQKQIDELILGRDHLK